MTKEQAESKVNGMTQFEMSMFIMTFWTVWESVSPAIHVAIKAMKKIFFWKKAYWIGIELFIAGLDELAAFKTSHTN